MLPRRLFLHFYGHCVLHNLVAVKEALANLLTHTHTRTDIHIKLSKGSHTYLHAYFNTITEHLIKSTKPF